MFIPSNGRFTTHSGRSVFSNAALPWPMDSDLHPPTTEFDPKLLYAPL